MRPFLKHLVRERDLTIRIKLTALVTLLIGVIALFIFSYFPAKLESQAMREVSDKAHGIAELMAFNISPALYFNDRLGVEEALAGLQRSEDLAYIVVLDEFGNDYVSLNRERADRASFSSTSHDHHVSPDGTVFRCYSPIVHNGQTIGRFYLGLSMRDLQTKVSKSRTSIALVSLVIFIIGMLTVLGISALVTGPLSQMVETAEKIAAGDLKKRAKISSRDEVGHLAGAFNRMVESLEAARRELEDANINLEKRVEARTKKLKQEISERKRAEREKENLQEQLLQAQKMKAIGTLAGGVAHDFNNLLTAIKGYAEIGLSKSGPEEPVHGYLEKIHYAGEKAANLTRQLLLFSRKQPMLVAACSVNDIIENFLKMLDRLIGEDVTIETELNPKLWTVQADEGNIEQVMLNLAVNARDAMPNGGTLTIKTENVSLDAKYPKLSPDTYPGHFVCISVSDTGCGIEADIIDRIFEPFFTTKGPGEGTGLGLSVVYGIVKEHKGWIGVYSEPGQGSVFKIYLPAVLKETPEGLEEDRFIPPRKASGERILLVEDEEAVREFAISVLRENGYSVIVATSAEEALQIFERENGAFDLVFSDIVLPAQNGLELVDQILSRNPQLPILLCSGYPDDKSKWSAIRERGFRFLQKPYSIHELLKAVSETLGTVVSDGEEVKAL